MTAQTLPRQWLTKAQAAAYLQCSTRTINRYVRDGQIPLKAISRVLPTGPIRISAEAVYALLETKEESE